MMLACATGVVQVLASACHRVLRIVVDAGHQLAVGGAGGGEFVVAFAELDAQVGGLLFELGDLGVERVDVGGRAESGLLPGLFAEEPGQALLELPDAGVEAGGAFVRGEQVSLQRGAGDCWAWFLVCRGRGGLQRVDLLEQVAVPVEEGAVDALLTELCLEFQQFSG